MTEVMSMYVARKPGESVKSARYHTFANCSMLEGAAYDEVTLREVELLGLKACAVCVRRQTGGPTIEALDAVLEELRLGTAEDTKDNAFAIVEKLKSRGVYLAQRKAAE